MGWICLIFHNCLWSRNLISCHSFLNGVASLSGHEVEDLYQKHCYAPPVSKAGTTRKREYKTAKCLLPTSDVLGRPQHRVYESLAYCATMLTPFFHVATCMRGGNNHSWLFTFSVPMRLICTHDVGGWLPHGCPLETAFVTQQTACPWILHQASRPIASAKGACSWGTARKLIGDFAQRCRARGKEHPGVDVLCLYVGVAAARLQCKPRASQHRSEACLLRYLSVDEGEFGANAGTRGRLP